MPYRKKYRARDGAELTDSQFRRKESYHPDMCMVQPIWANSIRDRTTKGGGGRAEREIKLSVSACCCYPYPPRGMTQFFHFLPKHFPVCKFEFRANPQQK